MALYSTKSKIQSTCRGLQVPYYLLTISPITLQLTQSIIGTLAFLFLELMRCHSTLCHFHGLSLFESAPFPDNYTANFFNFSKSFLRGHLRKASPYHPVGNCSQSPILFCLSVLHLLFLSKH